MQPAVLQVISSSGLYGAERVLLEIARHLQDLGWESHVGALLNRGQRRVAVAEVARRRGLHATYFPCGSGFDTRTMAALRRYVTEHGISVVHSHGYKADIFVFLSRARERAALVSTCHNWLTDSPKLLLYELMDKLVLQHFDRVVGVSPALDAELAAAGVAGDRRALIANGLSLEGSLGPADRARLRRRLGVEEGGLLLLAVGRLDPWKAYDVLIAAVAQMRARDRVHLALVGDGALEASLRRQIARLGLEGRVRLLGYRDDVPDLLRASDLFVLSSRKEGLPMVLLEALAAGLPVVATAVGAVPDALDGGRAGAVVPPGRPAALAAALDRLVAAPAERAGLAARGRQIYQARYSREAMGQRYVDLYRDLVERGAARRSQP